MSYEVDVSRCYRCYAMVGFWRKISTDIAKLQWNCLEGTIACAKSTRPSWRTDAKTMGTLRVVAFFVGL